MQPSINDANMSVQSFDLKSRFDSARRVVIKLGTNVVAGTSTDASAYLKPLVRSIARLKESGRQVVLVSSGAVGLGAAKLGLHQTRLRDVVTRQTCAAVGQSLLMQTYERLFSRHGIKIAQVLLTREDFTDRRRYLNLRHTTEKLLKLGVLPIVNENDVVSTAELEYVVEGSQSIFSDNDRLSALVMSKLEAEALVILTNVDGLLSRSPTERIPDSDTSEIIRLVTAITPRLKALAQGRSVGGRGGMLTKLEAAEIAMRAGGLVVIANGTKPHTLDRIFAGEQIGTAFVSDSRLQGKRRWIGYAASVRGQLVVNAGARDAIMKGKASLLASGVVRVEDDFDAMQVINIVDSQGELFARGISNYGSQEAKELIDSRVAASAEKRDGAKGRVMVTRNNIVLLER
jgi:glutamate 5-kinase